MQHCCSNCGFSTETKSFFRKTKGGVFDFDVTVCEVCISYGPTRSERRAILAMSARALVWGAAIAMNWPGNEPIAIDALIIAVTMLVTSSLRIIVHEAGHAFTAKAMGAEIWRVSIGSGPVKRTVRVGALAFDFCRYEFNGGAVWYSLFKGKHARLSEILTVAAGPAANFAVAILAAYAAYIFSGLTNSFAAIRAVFIGICLSQVLTGISNLIPRKSADDRGFLSDGWRLMTLFKKRLKYDAGTDHVMRVYGLTRQRRYDELITYLHENTNDLYAVGAMMNALSRSQGERAVIDYYLANEAHIRDLETTREGSPDPGLYLVQANAAWSAIKLADPAYFGLAQTLSNEALLACPNSVEAQGTRGAWFIISGEIDSGLALLTGAVRNIETMVDKAEFCTFLARGWRQKGHAERADLFDKVSEYLLGLNRA